MIASGERGGKKAAEEGVLVAGVVATAEGRSGSMALVEKGRVRGQGG